MRSSLLNVLLIPICAFLFSVTSAQAQTTPAPGTYVTEDGWGILEIKKRKSGTSSFALGSTGLNAHTCSLGGKVVRGQARLESYDDEVCVVSFSQERDTITVEANYACRYYCGANTSFDGDYRRVAPSCTPAAVEKAHTRFDELFKQKNYAAARDALEPVLRQCAATLPELEERGPIRNALALTYHKLGDAAACRAVLAPYRTDAAKEDQAIDTYDYAPYEKETYAAFIASVRTTLSLCEEAGTGKGQ